MYSRAYLNSDPIVKFANEPRVNAKRFHCFLFGVDYRPLDLVDQFDCNYFWQKKSPRPSFSSQKSFFQTQILDQPASEERNLLIEKICHGRTSSQKCSFAFFLVLITWRIVTPGEWFNFFVNFCFLKTLQWICFLDIANCKAFVKMNTPLLFYGCRLSSKSQFNSNLAN